MDEERRSDTTERHGEQPASGAVSDQNHEESSTPGGEGSSPPAQRDPADEDAGREDRAGESGRPGGAGEHSQATGHPDGAG